MKVTIQRVSLKSLGRMGCLLGAVAAFLPSLFCGVLSLGLALVVRRWLEGWQDVPVRLLGQELARLDFVHLLGLERVLDVLQVVAAASLPVLIFGVLVLALVSGALLAGVIALVGLAYNFLARATGGIVVEMAPAAASRPAPADDKIPVA